MEKKTPNSGTPDILGREVKPVGVGEPRSEAQNDAGTVEVLNEVRGFKTRSKDRCEYAVFLKFVKPPTNDQEFITAIMTILSQAKWTPESSSKKVVDLLRDHGKGPIN